MTIQSWLENASKKLGDEAVPTARLDCLVLLEDALGKDRGWLLAHTETEISKPVLAQLDQRIARRAIHEPLAYIRGKSEFYGRRFAVTADTLQPRPETETMIDLLGRIINSQKPSLLKVRPFTRSGNVNLGIVDVGTGSGCVGITVKLEFAQFEVIGIDVSEVCLGVARENAEQLGADMRFYQGDLLKPLSTLHLLPFALVANLPYVPDSHTINEAAMHEPKLAIFGGEDGLDLYRRMFRQTSELEVKPQYVLTEALPTQHKELEKIARFNGYSQDKAEDFIQVFKR